MLSVTTNLGDQPHMGLSQVSDERLARALKYLSLSYSAQQVAEISGVRIAVVRMMKAGLK